MSTKKKNADKVCVNGWWVAESVCTPLPFGATIEENIPYQLVFVTDANKLFFKGSLPSERPPIIVQVGTFFIQSHIPRNKT